jgi:sulfur relay (sulfurtransferase) DsrF/TusC family protein
MLVIVTKAPYGLEDAFAGLRLGLAMAVNGMRTSVVMVEDGVYNAVASQKPEAVSMPSNVEAIQDLYDFDVEVSVVKEDLGERGVADDRLVEGVKVVDRSALPGLITGHAVVTTF